MIPRPLPKVQAEIPYQNFTFREFEGINTQAARQGIKPTQFAWLENIQPVGPANLKVVHAISAALATLSGETVYYMKGYNISNTPYMFAACSSGAAYQINLNTNAVTTIAPAATFPATGTQIAQWKNERILIINQNNYYDWNGVTLTVLGGTTSAPTAGQCIATFAGRVWISQNRTINYSAAASYTSFAGSGGNTVISDEVLTSDIQQLLAANNFLYVYGINSINVIADVQVVGGNTQFSNTNISANSGSSLPQSIVPYYRSIWYMGQDGIYALYGATPRKASDALDGIFPHIDFTMPVSAGTVVVNNILCVAFLFTYDDPIAGARPVMAVYFGNKWFIVSQADDITVMATSHGTTDTLIAANGASLFEFFEDADDDIDWVITTALWDFGDMTVNKQALGLGIEVNFPGGVAEVSPTVDTETSATEPAGTFSGQSEFTWTNSLGQTFTWTNSLSQVFTWLTAGYAWLQGNVETGGHYLGITVEGSDPGIQVSGLQLKYKTDPGGWGDMG